MKAQEMRDRAERARAFAEQMCAQGDTPRDVANVIIGEVWKAAAEIAERLDRANATSSTSSSTEPSGMDPNGDELVEREQGPEEA